MSFSLIYDRLKQPPRAEVGKGNYVGGSRMDVCGKNGVLEKMRGAGASRGGGRKWRRKRFFPVITDLHLKTPGLYQRQ